MPAIDFGLTHESKFPELSVFQEDLEREGIYSEQRKIYSLAGPNEVFQISLTIDDWKALLGPVAVVVFHGALGEAGKDLYNVAKQIIKNTPSHLATLGRLINSAINHRLEPEFCVIDKAAIKQQHDVRFNQKIALTGDTPWDIAYAINALLTQTTAELNQDFWKKEEEFNESVLFQFLADLNASVKAVDEFSGLTQVQSRLLIQCFVCKSLSRYGSVNLTESDGNSFRRIDQTSRFDGPKDILTRVAALNTIEKPQESDLFRLANTNAAVRLLITNSSTSIFADPLIRKLFWRPGCPFVFLTMAKGIRAISYVPSSGKPYEVYTSSTGAFTLHPCA